MTYRLAKLEDFKEYAENCDIVLFRLDGGEVTLFAGRCCFKDSLDDKGLAQLEKWLKNRKAKEVVEDLPVEKVFAR